MAMDGVAGVTAIEVNVGPASEIVKFQGFTPTTALSTLVTAILAAEVAGPDTVQFRVPELAIFV